MKCYEYDAILHENPDDGGAYVLFPRDIRQEFGKGRVKVHACFDGVPYDGSIVNMGLKNEDGSVCYVIGVLKAIRLQLGKSDGDTIHVTIEAREDSIMEDWTCPKCGRTFKRPGQTHYCGKPRTVDDYIAAQEESVQPKLQELRLILRTAIPEAEERMSWSMPTFWKGQNLIHFAAAKKHIGLYPGGEATTVFAEELAALDVSKGTIRLPYDRELPEELIARIARWCLQEYAR